MIAAILRIIAADNIDLCVSDAFLCSLSSHLILIFSFSSINIAYI